MKVLSVYTNNSVFKYRGIFQDYEYEVGVKNQNLYVIKIIRHPEFKEEEHAVFRTWDYYLIEEE